MVKTEYTVMSIVRMNDLYNLSNQMANQHNYNYNPKTNIITITTYITWCLSNWNGFKLTAYERFEYIKGLKRQLERNPNDNGLIRQIKVQEVLYNRAVKTGNHY